MRAIAHMRDINKNFRFVVITDDEFLAKKFFPDFDVFHFDIAKDYVVLKNAKYLILSNSSFAWFPAWLNEDLRLCIAPKYWARHNISDGYWSCSYNLTQGWMYQDREGILSDYDTCKKELDTYMESHSYLFKEELEFVSPKDTSITGILKRHLPRKVKHFIKFLIGTGQRIVLLVRSPFDRAREKKRRAMWLSNVQIAEYRKNIKVYDVFNFFNELETLDIRLNILNEYVDYFVIVESTLTHSGKPKELFYEKNKHLFKEFEHKIIHYVITTPIKNRAEAEMRLNNSETLAQDREILSLALNSENTKNADDSFLRDFYEKESVKIPLEGLADNDFCFISDLDEIWNPETLVDFSKDDVYKFKQIAYVYYLNNRSNEDWRGWTGTIGTKYKNIRGACVNHLRKSKDQKYIVIENGGWHFTFQGGIDRIKTKIESYSHQELNTNETKSEINQRLTQNKDFAGRYFKFKIDETDLPPYLLKNKEKYKKFFK